MLSFSRDPKGYIQDLLRSQSRDLKVKGPPGEYWGGDKHARETVNVLRGCPGSGLTPLPPPR